MADFMPKDFGGVGLGYANWRKMANLDKSPFPTEHQSAGVAPPAQTFDQRLDKVQSKIAAVPKALGSFVQGDFSGAANALRPQAVSPMIASPVIHPVTQPTLQSNEPEEVDYMSQIWGTK